jgi:hypothetical protein
MKMFERLDALYRESKNNDIITPINIPKVCEEKYTDIKEYKRNYYLQNLQIYKERNKAYREKKKEEKKKLKENETNHI